jgi:hypothetical protein
MYFDCHISTIQLVVLSCAKRCHYGVWASDSGIHDDDVFLRNVTLRQCVISSGVSICPVVLNVGTLFVVLQFTMNKVKHHNTASNVMSWNSKLIFCNMYLTINWYRNRLANLSCLRMWTDPAYWHLFMPLTFLWRILMAMLGQVIIKYRYKGFGMPSPSLPWNWPIKQCRESVTQP